MSCGDTPVHSSPDSLRIHFHWLVRLRWGAIVGQLCVIAIVERGMLISLPLAPLGAILFSAVVQNGISLVWVNRVSQVREMHLALAMALDLLLFTGLLYLTGGPFNPFSSLYLIHIALAAVVLPPRWSWALVGLALLCSAGLFLDHVPLAGQAAHHHHHHDAHAGFDWHLRGMWVALGVAASFIVYFLHRVSRALAARDRELAKERERTLRHERAAAVATLAAGAAHELASPLGTIAVASSELESELRRQSSSEEILEDVVLIRKQVARCRAILDQLAADSGQTPGEAMTLLNASDIAHLVLSELEGRERVLVQMELPPELRLLAPPRAVIQAVRSLLENALHATEANQPVKLRLTSSDAGLCIEVTDLGVGMSREVLERAKDPFFTTRGAGRGMGLGLFLAQSVADQLGGQLELSSEPGQGTRAALLLPHSNEPATIDRIVLLPGLATD